MERGKTGIEFRRSGTLFETKGEKGVDVKLATDLLTLNYFDTAILVTCDQDYVPAIKAAKDSGKFVQLFTILENSHQPIKPVADRLMRIVDTNVGITVESFKTFVSEKLLSQKS